MVVGILGRLGDFAALDLSMGQEMVSGGKVSATREWLVAGGWDVASSVW